MAATKLLRRITRLFNKDYKVYASAWDLSKPMFTGSSKAVVAYCKGYCDARQATYTFYVQLPKPDKTGIAGHMVMFGSQYNNWAGGDD